MGSIEHHGKYRLLWQHLKESNEESLQMTFGDIERVLRFPLPPSSRKHLPHWYGYDGSAVARAIADAGWKSTKVDLNAQTVTFVRT
jgi:hypothetical protein